MRLWRSQLHAHRLRYRGSGLDDLADFAEVQGTPPLDPERQAYIIEVAHAAWPEVANPAWGDAKLDIVQKLKLGKLENKYVLATESGLVGDEYVALGVSLLVGAFQNARNALEYMRSPGVTPSSSGSESFDEFKMALRASLSLAAAAEAAA